MDSNNAGDRASAFPTFLAQDPYPDTSDGRPTTSSSNATSEFDVSKRGTDLPALTGPVGEPGLPPSRPTSNATTDVSQTWQKGASSRGSYAMPSSRRANYGRGGASGSRPSSAAGQTHVPSLTAQGFFRPMSPQALQAQRGQNVTPSAGSRVHSPVPAESVIEEQEQEPDRSYRLSSQSYASVYTERDARPSVADDAPPLPTSRGLSLASDTGDGFGGYGTPGPGSAISKNSVTPLNTAHVSSQQGLNSTGAAPPMPKSPRSFRASLGLGSRPTSLLRTASERRVSRSHEKLPSNPQSPIVAMNEKPVSSATARHSDQSKGKNYEYFGGNMLFFCSGRLVNTRANPLNVATFILTALPAALFLGFSAPWLWQNISPAIPIVFAYIFLVTLSSFLHAAFSDPGILPRNLHPHPPNPDEERDPLTVGPATTEWVMVKTFSSQRKHPSPQSGAENGQAPVGPTTAMEVPTKYCKSCGIWRPPRAHHCRVCDACMETQDHHCVWLNNCVGRRNYRFFFGFVGFASILALMLLVFSIVHVAYYGKQNNISFGNSLSGRTQERMAFAMFIYSLLALPYPGSLFVYHLFLVGRGETTREYLNSHKFLPKDRHRPFSQASLLANWTAVLGRPRPPTYMAFKHYYTEGDTRLGHTMRREERIQKAKLQAVQSESRVKGMKKRFSLPPPNAGGTTTASASQGTGTAMEMKQLPSPPPPPPPKEGNTAARSGPKKTPGNLNSTPR